MQYINQIIYHPNAIYYLDDNIRIIFYNFFSAEKENRMREKAED